MFLQHTELNRCVDVGASASVGVSASGNMNMKILEGNDATEDVPDEICGASKIAHFDPLARNRLNGASYN